MAEPKWDKSEECWERYLDPSTPDRYYSVYAKSKQTVWYYDHYRVKGRWIHYVRASSRIQWDQDVEQGKLIKVEGDNDRVSETA